MVQSIYYQIYEIFSSAIFGGDPSITAYGELFCEGFAILSCAFLISVPFILIYRIIRRFL